MSCTGNSGFIEITGPLLQTYIDSVSQDRYPLTINIAHRTTPPNVVGNRIEETTVSTSTCRDLNGNTFTLNDVQICSVTNKGYSQNKPVAELIVSFLANSRNTSTNSTGGVLLCAYIYDSGNESNAEYINQILETPDTTDIVTLESIFKSQSFGYKTCFETIDDNKNVESKNLYVVVFPDGIHLTSRMYEKLLYTIGDLESYRVPPAIRGGDYTVRNYKFNDKGKKIITKTSHEGIIYSTPISSCSDDFKHFIYFLKPPDIPKTSSSSSSQKCTYYDTTQYKCIPFNRLTDLSGEIVIPEGTKTLKSILGTKEEPESDSGLSTDTIDDILLGTGVVIGVCLVGLFVIKVVLPNL